MALSSTPNQKLFETICDLLMTPNLKIQGKKHMFTDGKDPEGTIRIKDENGDSYLIGIVTGRVKFIPKKILNKANRFNHLKEIQFARSEHEDIGFLALTHYNRKNG